MDCDQKKVKEITLDYLPEGRPRYGHGKPSHKVLYEIIKKKREIFEKHLKHFIEYKQRFLRIEKKGASSSEPSWINEWIPGLDAVALYSFLCMFNPNEYIEIGSGESTRFARRAIKDQNLQTKIISIDSHPRVEIGDICDEVIRKPLDKVDLNVFKRLRKGDILFIDGSHRVLTNSDVTIFFLDILPRLGEGVLVHFHDFFLPDDYPPEWEERYYSEQYMVAAMLLAETDSFTIELANWFIYRDEELQSILDPLWSNSAMIGVEKHGCSFWITIKKKENFGNLGISG